MTWTCSLRTTRLHSTSAGSAGAGPWRGDAETAEGGELSPGQPESERGGHGGTTTASYSRRGSACSHRWWSGTSMCCVCVPRRWCCRGELKAHSAQLESGDGALSQHLRDTQRDLESSRKHSQECEMVISTMRDSTAALR
ncbi:uncharacterized protein LOC135548844 isoform X1 [Oncorhynchus masou masou]|uniref:uncharacterized protein LOC135548844 isoform X1 n=1 Tax=Oncorhynchus masou masou TaxID=90313 RepID=UPI0031841788